MTSTPRKPPRNAFIDAERLRQGAWLKDYAQAGGPGHLGAPYRLKPELKEFNLAETIRQPVLDYFNGCKDGPITWHIHAGHGLSSQAACVNFLAPLADDPVGLAAVIGGALGVSGLTMLPVEDWPCGRRYVGFEWIGEADYLNETKPGQKRTRGANATSADAIVRFEHEGRRETLLIEWKYTEQYNGGLDPKGNPERERRYGDLFLAPGSPIKADMGLKLTDFFYEPFYQLLRQQMMAARMAELKVEPATDRVRVLHISPAGNAALHKVTSKELKPLGDDVFEVFAKVLKRPEDFVRRTTEEVFGPLLATRLAEGNAWATYVAGRYGLVTGGPA